MESGRDVAQPGDWRGALKEAAQHAVGG
jgi:hypothetical protein